MATLLGGAGSGASDYIAGLLAGVTMAHMHHFTVSGPGAYAKHMALGSLYEDLQGNVDELAEAFMGCTGQALKFSAASVSVGPDPVADVRALYAFAEGKRAAMGDESHIQNLVDEVCSTISTALYKLTRLA